MILSLVTGAISVANAASFLLLAPGAALAEYLACSAIYSLAVWVNLWILPSAWGYKPASIAKVRQGQLFVVALTGVILLITHPTFVGVAFVALLVLDTAIFFSSPLIYRSDTRLSQRIDFARACLATTSLVAALLMFDGSPTAFSLILAGLTLLMAGTLFLTGWHRPPAPALHAGAWGEILSDLASAFRQPQLLALLAARLVEITTLLVLGAMGQLAALVSVKIGLAISQALSTNARRYPRPLLLAAATAVYVGGLGAAMLAVGFVPALVPDTLKLISPAAAAIALPVVLTYFWLILAGLRANGAGGTSH